MWTWGRQSAQADVYLLYSVFRLIELYGFFSFFFCGLPSGFVETPGESSALDPLTFDCRQPDVISRRLKFNQSSEDGRVEA